MRKRTLIGLFLLLLPPSTAFAQGGELPDWDPNDTFDDFIFEDVTEEPFYSHLGGSFFSGYAAEVTFFDAPQTIEEMTLGDGSVRELRRPRRYLESTPVAGLTFSFLYHPTYSIDAYFGYSSPTAILEQSVIVGRRPGPNGPVDVEETEIVERAPVDVYSISLNFRYRKRVGRFIPSGQAGVGTVIVDAESEDISNSDLAFSFGLSLAFDFYRSLALTGGWRGFLYRWDFETQDESDARLGQAPIRFLQSFSLGLGWGF
jgi:hypothetical protein